MITANKNRLTEIIDLCVKFADLPKKSASTHKAMKNQAEKGFASLKKNNLKIAILSVSEDSLQKIETLLSELGLQIES